jgi:hypothetical protein
MQKRTNSKEEELLASVPKPRQIVLKAMFLTNRQDINFLNWSG